MRLVTTPPATDSGEAILNDICDLITRRLPAIPLDDPARPGLARITPQLAAALGRDPVRVLVATGALVVPPSDEEEEA